MELLKGNFMTDAENTLNWKQKLYYGGSVPVGIIIGVIIFVAIVMVSVDNKKEEIAFAVCTSIDYGFKQTLTCSTTETDSEMSMDVLSGKMPYDMLDPMDLPCAVSMINPHKIRVVCKSKQDIPDLELLPPLNGKLPS